MIEKAGIECPMLTGGSTGTYNIDTDIDGMTEIQPGSFVFMDIDYNRIGGQEGAVYKDFKNSLTVLTTVVSKPSDNEAVVDGGLNKSAAARKSRPFLSDLRVGRRAVHPRRSLAGVAPQRLRVSRSSILRSSCSS